jgi:hypothetical protein
MTARTIYCIQDVISGTFVTSSKHWHLGDFDNAALFYSHKTATAAFRSMERRLAQHHVYSLHGVGTYTSMEALTAWAERISTPVERLLHGYTNNLGVWIERCCAVGHTPELTIVTCTLTPQ